ncbi:MAG: hypothetical protein HGA47_06625 [Zoogloea sp.]|nr:hypothetical protein [Zoogloea sp.]
MNLPAGLFATDWHVAAALLCALAIAWCLRKAPWERLRDSVQLNVWLGSSVLLMLMWSMKAGVQPGLNLHLLGAMAANLVFGPQLAILGLALVLAGVTFNGAAEWAAYPLNLLVMGIVPVAVAQVWARIVYRILPRHFFVYIFVDAFMGAAVVAISVGVFASLLLFVAGVYPADNLLSNYLPFFLLLGFAEAWLSGMALTLMVVYRPAWVSTFDDREYIDNK